MANWKLSITELHNYFEIHRRLTYGLTIKKSLQIVSINLLVKTISKYYTPDLNNKIVAMM